MTEPVRSPHRTRKESPNLLVRDLAALAAIGALSVVLAWTGTRERRALRELPGPTRQQIYQRAFDDMAALCSDDGVPDAFAARCNDKALFLAKFPECRDECRRLIEPYLPKPTR